MRRRHTDLASGTGSDRGDAVPKHRFLPGTGRTASGADPLKEEAGLLSDAYGVEIYMGDQCERDFFDYTAEPGLRSQTGRKGAGRIENSLWGLSTDFFRQLGEGAYGALKIYLVGALAPAGAQGISDAAGLYFCSGNEQYLVLNLEEWASMRQTFYHETAHAIDCYINGTAYQSFQSGDGRA